MKQKTINNSIKAVFIAGIIFAMYFAVTQAPIVPIMKDGRLIGWKNIDLTASAGFIDPGAGKSGFLKVLIYKHHAGTFAVIQTYYGTGNMSINTSAYGNTFQNNSSNMTAIPWGQTFDIVVEFVWNATHAKNATNVWTLAWTRMNISCPALNIHNWVSGTGYTNMSKVNISGTGGVNGITKMYVHYYMNNNGSGYTLTKGQNVSHCFLQPSAYY